MVMKKKKRIRAEKGTTSDFFDLQMELDEPTLLNKKGLRKRRSLKRRRIIR